MEGAKCGQGGGGLLSISYLQNVICQRGPSQQFPELTNLHIKFIPFIQNIQPFSHPNNKSVRQAGVCERVTCPKLKSTERNNSKPLGFGKMCKAKQFFNGGLSPENRFDYRFARFFFLVDPSDYFKNLQFSAPEMQKKGLERGNQCSAQPSFPPGKSIYISPKVITSANLSCCPNNQSGLLHPDWKNVIDQLMATESY